MSMPEREQDQKVDSTDATIIKNIPDDEPEPPFSVFTPTHKKMIVILASMAALFSPLSANIYWPATTQLATDLNVSNSLINLTVTSYMIFQGIAPAFVGSLSDESGRRPSYLLCFILYIAANIGLALQNNYAALLVLRCLQSSGSSGTVALASAVVADVVTSAERGTYIGYATVGALIGPSFGPVIGGLLSEYLGWRAIFWFLAIFAGVIFIIYLIFFPETCRKVVGNGSVPPTKWNMSLLGYLALRKARREGVVNMATTMQGKRRMPNPLDAVRIVLDKESGMLLLFAGLAFTGFYMVAATLPSQLQRIYGFGSLQVGLCFIPIGTGSLISAFITGRMIDWNFRRHSKKLGLVIDKQKQQNLDDFPIEKARLEVMIVPIFFGASSIIGFGWVMEFETNLAAPLIFLFMIGITLAGAVNIISTLVVDLNRASPATATAAMNLARCLLGAGGVAVVDPMLAKLGLGWTCTTIAFIFIAVTPILWVVIQYGPGWRKGKKAKREQKEREKDAATNLEAGNQVV